MKSFRFLILFLVSALMLSLSSCNSCSSQKKEEVQGPPPTDFEKGMTAQDTAEVKQLVDKFFKYAEEKNFTEAAGMLYRTIEGSEDPQPLNNDEMAEVKKMLETFPMVDYRIEYIKFSDSEENEVLCSVIMQKAEGDMPEMATKMFFKPVNHVGSWLLCLTNTGYGDKGVVDPNKRDSVEKNYQKKVKAESVKP